MGLQTNVGEAERRDLAAYAAHGPVLAQATGFLTQITSTVTLYVPVTGAAWAVVSSNAFGVSNTILLWLTALHAALSFGIAISLWGIGNNFIQRLNLAQLLGRTFWPSVQELGEAAWLGVPGSAAAFASDGNVTPSTAAAPTSQFRHRAFRWPNLRFQRFWCIVPFLAGLFSLCLFAKVHHDGPMRKALCRQVANTLSFDDAHPLNEQAFERARYLFDKAGCQITLIEPRALRRTGPDQLPRRTSPDPAAPRGPAGR